MQLISPRPSDSPAIYDKRGTGTGVLSTLPFSVRLKEHEPVKESRIGEDIETWIDERAYSCLAGVNACRHSDANQGTRPKKGVTQG